MKASQRRETQSPRTRASPIGTITPIVGCMFSGKTAELLRILDDHPGEHTMGFKPSIDTRYSATHIVSHAGKAFPAIAVTQAWQIPAFVNNGIHVVGIDEAHFFDASIVQVCGSLTQRGIDVVLTALDRDCWGRVFPIIQELREFAERSVFLTTVCARCGDCADRTQRTRPIVNGSLVGGAESFEPRCSTCWRPPLEPAPLMG